MSNEKDTTVNISKSDKSKSNEMNDLNKLRERVKELNCLYSLTRIVRDKKLTRDEVLNNIVQLIPPSWQYPTETCARIIVKKRAYTTNNFKETAWKQTAQILAEETPVGALEVYYLDEKPTMDIGPFMKEEQLLIEAIADLIGKYLNEQYIKEQLEDNKKKLDTVEKIIQKQNGRTIHSFPSEHKQDWEVIIYLLIRTDPRLLLRITRKMVYYLYRFENEKITDLLETVCPVDRNSDSQRWCGINMPNPRQNIASLKDIQQQVFEIARENIPPEELSNLFENWMKQDKIRPLLLVSQKQGTPLVEIVNELIRFYEKPDAETNIAPEDKMSLKTALIRRFFTDRLEYVNVAKQFIEVEDFVPLLKHVVGPAQGTGKLGGKTSGVFLAQKILEHELESDESLKGIAFPRSWYLSSDALLEFIHYNDLDEVFHHKYLDPAQIRQEQSLLEQIFKNAVFPPEIIEGFRRILRDIHDRPIIVRSSSLLEDSFGAAFSGKYKSLFVPNTGTEDERLESLMDAISEVYASTFGPDPIEYRRERGLLDFSEEMGVLIQEVVGTNIGKYFMPSYGGVAFSRNEFRWSQRIQREDGVIRIVPGLGTRAVDRVGNDYPILVSPNRPNLQVNQLVSEKIKYSPRFLDVINLETGAIETIDAIELFKEYGDEYPDLDHMVSILKDGWLVSPQKYLFDPKNSEMVITFSNLFDKTDFLKKMQKILAILESKIKTPVDIEFASDGKQLYFLQCRPQSQSVFSERKPIPKDILASQKLFSANKFVTTGQIENIEYLVYVRPNAYGTLETREDMQKIARIIGELNMILPRRRFILLGPGRWGSRGDIKLGVPVQYGDINNTALLIEIAKETDDYTPELSFGTHFFQDLVEANIKYLPLYPDRPKNIFNEKEILLPENQLPILLPNYESYKDVIHVCKISDIIAGGSVTIVMDGDAGEALGYLKPPDHWKWRLNKAEEIAESLDPELYGVKAVYLIGSTKDGNAGPASDIDILVHFSGTEEQLEKLNSFFQRWSKILDEENQERTGIISGGILDVHVITDEDIKNNTSWASHITSSYNTVRKLSLGKK